MAAPIVFFDIAGPDADALKEFYSQLFGWECDQTGQFAVQVAPTFAGAIRGDPAQKRVYLGVDDVTRTLDEVVRHGGAVDVPRFEVPGVVVLGLFRDPAGNPMGLVEFDGEKPRIP